KIIENIQLLHECKKDHDEHLLQVIAEAQTDNDAIDPVLLPANQYIDGEGDMDDSENLLELLCNLDEYTTAAINATKKSTEEKYIAETIEAVKNAGRFSHLNTHHQPSSNEFIDYPNQKAVPFVSATPNLIRLNTKWQEQPKTETERVRRSLITGNYDKADDTLDLHAAKDAVVTVVNPNNYKNNNFENYGSILPVVSVTTNFPTPKTIADEFTLNREQRAAFMIITSHLDGDSRCRTDDNNSQLIICIPGCGGTGKSQLIRAVSKYFLITKRIQMMRKFARNGIAAAEIGGMTIHSFLGEQRNSGKPRTIKPGDSKLEKEWRLVEYLLIDEMSMVGLNLLAKLNRIICSAKHADPQVSFGGVNVIFFGDHLQYRPAYDSPLHTDFSLPLKKKSGKLPNENEIQQRVARSLILQINCVVKLTQQMRTEDPRYLQLLERLRHGQCTYDDYELLLTQVVGQPSVGSLRDSPWNKVIRTHLNNKAVIHKATRMRQEPMVCVAQGTCKGKPIDDPTLVKKLLELSDSKTEHLPGLLPFVPGMPVILTQNIAIELGLINGMNEIFRQLVYEEDSVSTNVLSETFPNNTRYIYKPLYALIEIIKSKIECNLEQRQPNIIPIPVMEQTFRIDIADVLPKKKRSKSNQKVILSIKRRALPLVPAYSITTHKSQGQTLNNVIIDLKLPNETDDIAAIYVPLSRVKRLADLIILRHFDFKVLLMKPIVSEEPTQTSSSTQQTVKRKRKRHNDNNEDNAQIITDTTTTGTSSLTSSTIDPVVIEPMAVSSTSTSSREAVDDAPDGDDDDHKHLDASYLVNDPSDSEEETFDNNLHSQQQTCQRRDVKCGAVVHLSLDTRTFIDTNNVNHQHPPDRFGMKQKLLNQKIDDRLGAEPTAVMKVIELVYAEANLTDEEQLNIRLPRTAASTFYKKRSRRYPAHPKTQDFNIPHFSSTNNRGENFVIYDGNKERLNGRLLIFSTPKLLSALFDSDIILCDGTFKTRPLLFQQVYVLMGRYHDETIPLVWCLTSSKTQSVYHTIWKKLQKVAKHMQMEWKMAECLMDFERAMINSCLEAFPNVHVKCCWYHFVQALWRKIQKLGLTTSYETDPLVNTWFKQYMALPLILRRLIDDGLQLLKDTIPSNDYKYRKFLKYFEKEYIKRPSIDLWHHGNNDMKTNNSLEGYNFRLLMRFGLHPSIWEFLHFLKDEEALVSHLITHLVGGSGITSSTLVYSIMQFISKSIGLKEYLKSASLMVGKIVGQSTNEKTYDQATANEYLLEDEDEND
ncbi:unnamed protein product, partial [Rotaria sp. Silwood2]